MKQLGPLDSAFINLENANTPQHIGALAIYDPSTAPGQFVRFKDVIENFDRRLQNMPLFRTRLRQVPGGLGRPYWVEDKDFDLEFHLRHIALPQPGDWRQLWIQAARLHSRPIDMSHPLWEVYIIERLDNLKDVPKGAFAIYTKMHHSLVDGSQSQGFMQALHDLEPDPPKVVDNSPSIRMVDQEPSGAELLARAVASSVKDANRKAKGLVGFGRNLVEFGRRIRNNEIPAPDMSAPATRFNNRVGPHRVAEASIIPLDDFKYVKNVAGVTINDVAVSVIAGAMRKYLEHHGELPEASVAATMPLNMNTRGVTTTDNNNVGAMHSTIHSDIEDPFERLLAVNESLSVTKSASDVSPMTYALNIAGEATPWLSQSVAKMWSKNHLSKYIPVNVCTNISNVPGPNFPMYCAGAKLIRYHGLGLLTPGIGSFHLVFSNNGVITITLLADRDIVPDPTFYRECIDASFEETLAAAKQVSAERDAEAAKQAKASARKKPKTKVKAKAKAKAKVKAKAKTKAKTKAKAKSEADVAAKASIDAQASAEVVDALNGSVTSDAIQSQPVESVALSSAIADDLNGVKSESVSA